mmetsp:Transcript_64051/g.119024  ORF Transcript_64051/g.119024 Transcript_64051/m.119024 type:complete len:225 (-) Transcript_64051:14-688(-)
MARLASTFALFWLALLPTLASANRVAFDPDRTSGQSLAEDVVKMDTFMNDSHSEDGPMKAEEICDNIDEFALYNSNGDKSGPVKYRPGQLWFYMTCKRSKIPFVAKTHDVKVKVIARGGAGYSEFMVVDVLEAKDLSSSDMEGISTAGIPLSRVQKDPQLSRLPSDSCTWTMKGQFGTGSSGKTRFGKIFDARSNALKFDAFRAPPDPKVLMDAKGKKGTEVSC